jgi:integrase/recombinase XerD
MNKEELSNTNSNAIMKYMTYFKTTNHKKQTIDSRRYKLNMLFLRTKKDYDEITIDEILKILSEIKSTTAEVMKSPIRDFFRYYNRPEIYENIPSNSKVLRECLKDEESVLTEEEINKIIEAPKKLRDKAIIETFITTGIRNNELRNIKISDVNIDDPITTWIKIKRTKVNNYNSKTPISIVPNPEIPSAKFPKYLREWYRQNKDLPKETYLFYSESHGRYHQKLSKRGIQMIVESAQKNSGINKTITPHIFRHTSATYYGKVLNENMLRQKYGWKPNSNMVEKYCHHNEKQLEDIELKIAGYTEEEKTKGRICPQCNENNNLNEDYCIKCKFPLNPNELKKIYENTLKEKQETEKLKEKYEQELNELKEEIKDIQSFFSKIRWNYGKPHPKKGHILYMIPESLEPIEEQKYKKFKEKRKNK